VNIIVVAIILIISIRAFLLLWHSIVIIVLPMLVANSEHFAHLGRYTGHCHPGFWRALAHRAIDAHL